VPLAIAGAGATPALAARLGARHLAGDPVTEAERLARRSISGAKTQSVSAGGATPPRRKRLDSLRP